MMPRWSLPLPVGFVLSVLLASAAAAQELHGRVVGVADGDTLTVLDGARRQVKVRLAEIDTPESGQPYGDRARQALSDLAFGKAVRVAVVDTRGLAVERYLLVGQRVWNLALSTDGSRLYTTNGVSNDLSVIDTAAMRAVRSVPVGQAPWGVVVRP